MDTNRKPVMVFGRPAPHVEYEVGRGIFNYLFLYGQFITTYSKDVHPVQAYLDYLDSVSSSDKGKIRMRRAQVCSMLANRYPVDFSYVLESL